MDAKLKALKVVDLRHILATAAVSVPAKATKPDLIAKILATKQAQDAYAQLYPPDDLLAPPEDVDWNVDQPDSPPSPQKQPPPAPAEPVSTPAAPAPAPKSQPVPAPKVTSPSEAPPSTEVDEELEKRKRRAERFGIPLVQPREKKPRTTTTTTTTKPSVPAIDPKLLEQRAARFGTSAPASNPKKRSAQQVDPEEEEKRRKRAERFGIQNKD